MKKIILIFLELIIIFTAKTQITQTYPDFHYTYDNNGNRIQREYIIICPLCEKKNHDTTKTKTDSIKKYTANLGDQKITVYPNPTTGILKIDITNLTSNNKGTILLADMKGRMIYEDYTISSTNIINLLNISKGYYALKVSLNGKNKEWMIMKE
jgi:hypothetical protein